MQITVLNFCKFARKRTNIEFCKQPSQSTACETLQLGFAKLLSLKNLKNRNRYTGLRCIHVSTNSQFVHELRNADKAPARRSLRENDELANKPSNAVM